MVTEQGEGTLERYRTGTGLHGKDVILEYYRRYNGGDVDGVMELMAPNCQCELLFCLFHLLLAVA